MANSIDQEYFAKLVELTEFFERRGISFAMVVLDPKKCRDRDISLGYAGNVSRESGIRLMKTWLEMAESGDTKTVLYHHVETSETVVA
jgi:hypothetical protein